MNREQKLIKRHVKNNNMVITNKNVLRVNKINSYTQSKNKVQCPAVTLLTYRQVKDQLMPDSTELDIVFSLATL